MFAMTKQARSLESGFVPSVLAVLMCYCLAGVVGEVQLSTGAEVLNKHDRAQYKDCREVLKAGYNVSGVYRLYMDQASPFFVTCEFRDGRAYTVIQRRQDYSVDFTQPLAIYQQGFGYHNSSFWIGLDIISHLTMSGSKTLTIYMQDFKGSNRNAHYSTFKVQPKESGYLLTVGGFTGYPLADDLGHSNGMKFYTYDTPDPHRCALQMKAGWWYNYCAYTLLNGYYYPPGPYKPWGALFDGLFWQSFGGFSNSLKYAQMAVS